MRTGKGIITGKATLEAACTRFAAHIKAEHGGKVSTPVRKDGNRCPECWTLACRVATHEKTIAYGVNRNIWWIALDLLKEWKRKSDRLAADKSKAKVHNKPADGGVLVDRKKSHHRTRSGKRVKPKRLRLKS